MKSVTTKILVLLLAALMVLPVLAACGDPKSGTEETTGGNVDETVEHPTVSKKDYDAEFTVLYTSDIYPIKYYILDEDERQPGNDMDDKVYDRIIRVKDHLGVDVKAVDGGNFGVYLDPLRNAISAGDDTYQMVMTHVHRGIAGLITENYLRDFNDFDSIDLEADYWNAQMMEDLSINDAMYCGYNDFMLANCYILAFNKGMVEEYARAAGNLYDHVRNKTWTMEKFIQTTTLASRDNGDGQWDDQDTYGLSGWSWVPLISFQIGCDIPIVQKNGEGDLYFSPMQDNADKIVELDEMIYNLMKLQSTYSWGLDGSKPVLHISSGRVMFEMIGNFALVGTKEEEVKVGVLPYPLWDSKQKDYLTMSWNGVMGIPTTVKNDDMVGDTLEMLAWYSDPVTISFYETLLGSKVADAPEDAEMLNIIWRNQVSDIGQVFSDSSDAMDQILYAIPRHATGMSPAYATHYRGKVRTAQFKLDAMFNS